MSEEEIEYQAWSLLLNGAESSLEDWWDEEGLFGDDSEAVEEKAWAFLTAIELMGPGGFHV